MLIREIASADGDSYFALRLQSEQEFPQFVGLNAERELAAGPSGIAALLSAYPSEGTLAWGAFAGGRLAGVMALSRRLSRKYGHKAFLWGMYVVPEQRGNGTAHALMHTGIARAKQHPDIVAISLQVAVSNIRGQNFYKKYGFTVFGTEQRSLFAAGQFHGVHYMALDVKPAQPSGSADLPAAASQQHRS